MVSVRRWALVAVFMLGLAAHTATQSLYVTVTQAVTNLSRSVSVVTNDQSAEEQSKPVLRVRIDNR